MKKILSLLLTLVLVSSMTVTVFAFKQENKNQVAQVLSITEGAEEFNVYSGKHLQEKDLMELLAYYKDLVPEDANIKHLTMIRQRDVVSKTLPIEISLRSWGADQRYLLVFFKPAEGAMPEEDTETTTPATEGEAEDKPEWELLAIEKGSFIDATFPCNGQYALAWNW